MTKVDEERKRNPRRDPKRVRGTRSEYIDNFIKMELARRRVNENFEKIIASGDNKYKYDWFDNEVKSREVLWIRKLRRLLSLIWSKK